MSESERAREIDPKGTARYVGSLRSLLFLAVELTHFVEQNVGVPGLQLEAGEAAGAVKCRGVALGSRYLNTNIIMGWVLGRVQPCTYSRREPRNNQIFESPANGQSIIQAGSVESASVEPRRCRERLTIRIYA